MIEAITVPTKYTETLAAQGKRLEDFLTTLTESAQTSYNRTTRTWRKPPEFVIRRVVRGDDIVYSVSTDSEVYGYVDRGTRPHIILPRGKANGGADMLRFRAGFKSKTTPNRISSRQGRSFGPVRFSDGVQHPGTEARNFTKIIVQRSEKRARGIIRASMK